MLTQCFERRKEQDLIVKLHTGGGKTLVGLLIAKSILNELKSPILYLCPTKQLVQQTLDKAREYYIDVVEFARNILKTGKLKPHYIEQLSPKILHKIIVQSVQLLENYPHNLRYFCKKTRLTNETVFLDKVRRKKSKLPSWFFK